MINTDQSRRLRTSSIDGRELHGVASSNMRSVGRRQVYQHVYRRGSAENMRNPFLRPHTSSWDSEHREVGQVAEVRYHTTHRACALMSQKEETNLRFFSTTWHIAFVILIARSYCSYYDGQYFLKPVWKEDFSPLRTHDEQGRFLRHAFITHCHTTPLQNEVNVCSAHLSHLSLLFLHGSQLIAFLARFGAGGFTSADWLTSVGDGIGECGRLCFTRGCDEVEGE